MPRSLEARRRLTALVVTVALLATLGLVHSQLASAHVEYETAEPAADSVQIVAPTTVAVSFSGEIGQAGSVLEVYAPDGARVDNNDLQLNLFDLDRRELSVTLQPDLPDGVYRVRVGGASIDGHEPEIQEFQFTIATGGTLATPVGATPAIATPMATPTATPIAAISTRDGAVNSDEPETLSLIALLLLAVAIAVPFLAIVWRNRRIAGK